MKIKTNNRPRDVLRWYDLTEKERAEFDYIDTKSKQECATFFRYKSEAYDLDEFVRWDNPASPTRGAWDGFRSDSYFSGLAIRYVQDFERVVVALVLS